MTTHPDIQRGDAVHRGDPVIVDRYTAPARINHWITAISLVLLAISGLSLFHPSLFFLTGLFGGVGNIGLDPLFVAPASDDFRLSLGSPCIDAGSDAAVPPDSGDLDGDANVLEQTPHDLDGLTRIVNKAVDMGAYEAQ